MIDFHTHIIPNVDDGVKSVDETFALIKEAKQAGFDAIISTSHYKENVYESEVSVREFWIKALQESINKENIDLKLYLGNEIYFTEKIIKLLEGGFCATINNTSYVLFEFPLNTKPINIYEVIYDMIEAKIVPVLAHPERYSFVQKDPELVYDLIQSGVLMQANFGSVIGRYGEKAQIISKKLLENDMIHFLGSDVHKPGTIYPKINKSLNVIKSIIGNVKLMRLTTVNPMLALENKRIEIDNPKPIKLSFKEKMIMNLKK